MLQKSAFFKNVLINKQKYPLASIVLRNQGVLAILARIGTEKPSPTSKKRDSLEAVSLVREAGLEFKRTKHFFSKSSLFNVKYIVFPNL